MPTRHARLPLLALAAALAITATTAVAPARASLIVALDTPAMVAGADTIAVVDVASVRAAWDARHERIVTTVELIVVESWKGAAAPAARVVVAQPGGTVDDITMTVFGMPRFSPGERALVFLHGPTERAGVVGLAQGKRTMRPDPVGAAGGRWLIAPPQRAGAAFVRTATSGPRVPVFDAVARPLDEVRAEIRAEMRTQAVRGGVR
jgi:hypothetical protein